MPHLIVSVSSGLAEHVENLLTAAHQAMLDSELTTNADVKSRAQIWQHYRVGNDHGDGFVHAEVRLMDKAERTEAARKRLADAILAALAAALPEEVGSVQFSCETVAMNAASYAKQRRGA